MRDLHQVTSITYTYSPAWYESWEPDPRLVCTPADVRPASAVVDTGLHSSPLPLR
jgi:hypothetical protein